MELTLGRLLAGTAADSFDDGIMLDAVLEPLTGPGGTVKPAIYPGGQYQADKRWPPASEAASDGEPQAVFVIDNVPSQANRLEEALRASRPATGVPEMILDLTGLDGLPAHLLRRISSWHFPHRNADAYLRDATDEEGTDFSRQPVGRDLFAATTSSAAALVSWWPQALLYGFWQSHLGKKRSQAKHARAWTSEIIGWQPAAQDTRIHGLKGDPLNLSIEEDAIYDDRDHTGWHLGSKAEKGETKKKLSEIGHGQVPFGGETPAGVSFRLITQRATVSFAQLRRIGLGTELDDSAATAARALLVAMGLHAHVLAFGRGFSLRSGADLRVLRSSATWLGNADETLAELDASTTESLLQEAKSHSRDVGVSLEGWDREPLVLLPKANLEKAIAASWPLSQDT
ncbi:MAG: type I-U CRISPR-associated protein Cas7 [Acidimicrobiaceae bacterium]|nr:type I-U CRISPR-associated protein Cas7 [Acidimicrobiaceae bacterium]MYE09163.1 type I-U CRISPR-associated protein Cas7 [Acidimicrobiaceae bacterium]